MSTCNKQWPVCAVDSTGSESKEAGGRAALSLLQSRAGAEREGDIGGMGRLLDEAPEDLPRRNPNVVIPIVVPADVQSTQTVDAILGRLRSDPRRELWSS
jgi:hypothetical protein